MTAEEPIQVLIPVCGDGGTGKTCLILKFWHNIFDPEHIPTSYCETAHRSLCLNGKHYDIAMRDTVGQEKYGATPPAIYKDASVILICFDPTFPDAKANIKKWVDWVDEYRREDSKLILVATKSDLWNKANDPPIDLVSEENTDALCAEFHAESLWKTSAKTGTQVSEMFSHAAEIAPIRKEDPKRIEDPDPNRKPDPKPKPDNKCCKV